MRLTGDPPPLVLPQAAEKASDRPGRRVAVVGCEEPVPVMDRSALNGKVALPGPAVILDAVATTWREPGWTARLDRVGNLLLERP